MPKLICIKKKKKNSSTSKSFKNVLKFKKSLKILLLLILDRNS